jgi:transcriptional regulator with XRE-family HTH domain
VDVVRVGLSLRALRRRRRLSQERLASRVGLSRQTIVRIERGHADSLTLRTIERVATALGASVNLRILWHGEGLDRLLDAAHADLTDAVLQLLRSMGWEVATELSFNMRGDRGTIDILGFHADTGSLLVIEIKSVVPDLQAMLGTLDRKVRVAEAVASERGWRAQTVSRLLVLPDDRTARRRVERHGAVFGTALPSRTVTVRQWLKAPVGRLAGILFLSDAHHVSTRH